MCLWHFSLGLYAVWSSIISHWSSPRYVINCQNPFIIAAKAPINYANAEIVCGRASTVSPFQFNNTGAHAEECIMVIAYGAA